MKVAGSHTIAAPREQVWHMLQDPDVLAKATPGVKEMEREREDFYRAVLELGIGPVKGTFSGHVEVTEKHLPDSLTLAVDGSGGPGGVKAIGGIEARGSSERHHRPLRRRAADFGAFSLSRRTLSRRRRQEARRTVFRERE